MPFLTGKSLFVNDGPLEPSLIAPLKPSSLDLPLAELRRRFQDDGYLFVKGLLPRDAVFKVRKDYFEFLEPSGVLKPGSEPVKGVYDASKDISLFPGVGAGGNDPSLLTAEFTKRALDAHSQDWYSEEFCKHPVLLDFMARFTGWGSNTLPFKRTLLRNNVPGAKAIGVHYDQIFLRHGEPTSITVWVPMGDISIDGGGLIYLENAHGLGKELEDQFTSKAKASGLTEEEARSAFNQNMMATGLLSEDPASFARQHNRRWLVSAYEAGDVVLHNPYTIHASTINHDPDNIIRLATDLRFVDCTKPWDERWAHTYKIGDGV